MSNFQFENTENHTQEVIDKVKAYLKESGCKQAKIAKSIHYKDSVVSQVLNGSYPANPEPIIIAMEQWLSRRKKSDEQPEVNRFVVTEVVSKVRLAANIAMRSSDANLDSRIALVWGDAGCGKTYALKDVAESENGIFITCGVGTKSERTVIEKIAEELRCGTFRSTAETVAEVIKKLRGSGTLIVVDEIHSLLDARDDSAFHALRRLSDETGCPQIWGANCDLIKHLKWREKKREPLGQITRRICCQFHLTAKLNPGGTDGGGKTNPLFTTDQIGKMFGSNEMPLSHDGARFLAGYCRNPSLGLLGDCTKFVFHATTMNRNKVGIEKELTPLMLWDAAQHLFQYSILQQVLGSLGELATEFKLKLKVA